MKQAIRHEIYGEIVYEETFFTGKKSISIGGVPLEKVSKKQFRLQDGSDVTVSGGYLYGTTMNVKGETIQLTPKIKWYEIVLCILPFILIMVWGNMPSLCAIVPVVGGAIGGGVAGMCCFIGLFAIKSVKQIWLKIIVALVSLCVTFGICAGIGFAILSAFAK